ncbi:MAG TPA: hypothetical protein VFE63_03730 [Roseiarcus sp.]|jgi:hypothetical protein|nr:hypothetical protein [Roseiarcus sp.]
MAPAPALTRETLAQLGAERLAELALDEAARNRPFKKLVLAALAAARGPGAVASIVDKRLAGLEKARASISRGRAKSFSEDLWATLKIITGDLATADSDAAAAGLMRFLATADRTLDRGEGGAAAQVYQAAAEALPALVGRLSADESAPLADQLYALAADSRRGMVLPTLAKILAASPPEVVDALDARLVEAMRALGPFEKDDWSRRARARRLVELRQRIADARADVDAFIALETDLPGHSPDAAEIAERLIDAGRAQDALEWLRRPAKAAIKLVTMADLRVGLPPRDPAADRRGRLEIRALEALGERAQARALRWKLFEETLDAAMLREHLAHLPDFEDVEALDAAFAHALASPLIYAALRFLIQWPRLDLAERLVVARRAQWDGRRYESLAPAAETLEPGRPLAAVILYRALINAILDGGHTPAYRHAARYYAELESLAERENPGWPIDSAQTYRAELRFRHGRKFGFWSLVTSASGK